MLIRFPEAGRQSRQQDVRILLVGNTGYLIVYRAIRQAVEILRVRHEREDRRA
jgi:plasmid stabilization system protein ParE